MVSLPPIPHPQAPSPSPSSNHRYQLLELSPRDSKGIFKHTSIHSLYIYIKKINGGILCTIVLLHAFFPPEFLEFVHSIHPFNIYLLSIMLD